MTSGNKRRANRRHAGVVVVFTPRREQPLRANSRLASECSHPSVPQRDVAFGLRPDKKKCAVACSSGVVVTATAEPVTSSTRGSAKTCHGSLGLVVQ